MGLTLSRAARRACLYTTSLDLYLYLATVASTV